MDLARHGRGEFGSVKRWLHVSIPKREEDIHLALKEVLVAFEACCFPFPSLTLAFYVVSCFKIRGKMDLP